MKATCWLVTLAVYSLLCGMAVAAESLHWHTDLESAKREAAATNRLVLVHFGAPWCGPCMRLEREVFSQPGFGGELTTAYVPVKLNLDNAPQTARQYGVTSIPADVVITAQGKLIGKLQSPPDATRYVGQLMQVAATQREPGTTVAGPRYASSMPAEQAAPEQIAAQPAAEQAPAAPPQRTTSANEIGRAFSSAPPASAAAPSGPSAPAERPAVGDRYADYFNRHAAETLAAADPVDAPPAPPRARQTTTTWSHEPMDPDSALVRQAANREPPSPPTPENLAYEAQQPAASTVEATAAPSYRSRTEAPRTQMASSTIASQPASAGPVAPPGNPPLGLEGYCPVHLTDSQDWQRGDARWGAIHRGRTYLFVSQACQQKFLAEPDRYSPVLQGSDPVIALEENRLVEGRREFGVFFNRRVYLFSSAATRDRFESDPNRYAGVGQQP
jgi:YHS domain-containing protein/thiol-disulfide isomerase/thioredoxin